MASSKGTRVFMERNGIVKEISVDELPNEVVVTLEKAYKRSRIVGISRRVYGEMVEATSIQLAGYSQDLPAITEPTNKHRLFASYFDINSLDYPLMYASLLWIDVCVEDQSFTSKNINMRNLREFLSNYRSEYCSYAKMQKEFKKWNEENRMFTSRGVGFVKMLKMYFSVITCPNFQVATNY